MGSAVCLHVRSRYRVRRLVCGCVLSLRSYRGRRAVDRGRVNHILLYTTGVSLEGKRPVGAETNRVVRPIGTPNGVSVTLVVDRSVPTVRGAPVRITPLARCAVGRARRRRVLRSAFRSRYRRAPLSPRRRAPVSRRCVVEGCTPWVVAESNRDDGEDRRLASSCGPIRPGRSPSPS